jgi:hypothetical protein
MNQPFQARHARSLLAGIQEGEVDSRLRTAGMTEVPTLSIGSLAQQIGAHVPIRFSGRTEKCLVRQDEPARAEERRQARLEA